MSTKRVDTAIATEAPMQAWRAFAGFLPGMAGLQSAFEMQAAFAENLMQLQRRQLEIVAAWQKTVNDVGQELWDEWVCRFGGGVPLDA